MTDSTASGRYTSVAVALHWVIAIALILQLYVGFFHDDFPREVRGDVMSLHKSLGITVLLLSVVRLVWRLMHRPPPLPEGLKAWERGLSHAVHWGLYVVMIGAPLAGWAMTSASPKVRPIPFWGAEFPALPLPREKDLMEAMAETHEVLGFLAVVLIALHLGGALKHRFIDGHDVLWRMIPFLKAPK